MELDSLGAHQLLIFAGKGGVGKTTCSAATAIHFAAQGKKTLLVTVDPAKRLEDSLGVALGSEEREVRPGLFAAMLDPEEIIRHKLAGYAEGQQVLDHPLFRYVTNYLPGLNELMAIGRLNEVRHENAYDLIVIDTAPTGHALSFLSAPKAIQELMSEKSLLRWVLRAHNVWVRFSKASRGVSRFFDAKKKDADEGEDDDTPAGQDARAEAEDVDLELVFQRLADEARGIQEMLTDTDRTALNIVTLPEKLPVEETVDLHDHAIQEIGIHIGCILVNKVQPDPLGPDEASFRRLMDDAPTTEALQEAFGAAGYPPRLMDAMVRATEFSDIRRRMNLLYIGELDIRMPKTHKVLLPLLNEDVEGLDKLEAFERVMYGEPAAKGETVADKTAVEGTGR